MITYLGHKCTATQLAKLLVAERGESAYYWHEDLVEAERPTAREIDTVHRAIDKQAARVRKLLNYSAIFNVVTTDQHE